MKLSTIKRKHKDKWILAKVEKTDEAGEVVEAKTLATSKSKHYIYKRAKDLKDKHQHFTIFFAGKPTPTIWI